jgi:hypothetical protein
MKLLLIFYVDRYRYLLLQSYCPYIFPEIHPSHEVLPEQPSFEEQEGRFDVDLKDFVPRRLRTVQDGTKEGIHRGIRH